MRWENTDNASKRMTDGLGDLLWRARLDGRQVDRPDPPVPADISAAYAIQSAQIDASGMAVGGWKIGATNKTAQSMLGFDAPFVGPVFKRDIYRSGAEVPIFSSQVVGLECEFAVELAQDIANRPKPYTRQELLSRVAAIRPGFEIVALRFTGGVKGAGPLLIMDGGGNSAIVVGGPVTSPPDLDFNDHRLNLSIAGKPVASGGSAATMWEHPVDAVAWLVAQPALAPRGLRAGDIIMTGSCTGLTPIEPGTAAAADFGAVGKVAARFVTATPAA